MIWRIRIAVLTSVVLACTFCTVRADEKAPADKKEPAPAAVAPPAAPAAPAPMYAPAPVAAPVEGGSCGSCGSGCGSSGGCGAISGGCGSPCAAPSYKTVCVTEWVPEYYKTTRTSYKKECVSECYTAYKTECVPECHTRNVTSYERVCEMHDVTRTVCEKVCTQEPRCVTHSNWTCVPVTTMTCKTVDNGHWECKEVACSEGILSKLKGGLFSKHHGSSCGCADACGASCGGCADACTTCCAPPTKTVKVWVSCKTTVQVPCTHMERKCETTTTTEMVNVWKTVSRQVCEKVACWKCVPVCKTENYTTFTTRCVPYQATRLVSRCVPVCEEVTACRMVAHTVQKQVACENTCNTCCEKPSLHDRLRGKFSGLFAKHGSCGCESTCGSTCGSSCGCN